jgi:hypothetical protein
MHNVHAEFPARKANMSPRLTWARRTQETTPSLDARILAEQVTEAELDNCCAGSQADRATAKG